jgi:hypothetical protein
MSQTDTRSGFRLPWSSDRAHEDTAGLDAANGAPEAVADPEAPQVAWPSSDFAARLGITPNAPRPQDSSADGAPSGAEPGPARSAPTQAPAPRKAPTKLMADLAAAIRATTEAARDQRLSQADAEAQTVVDMIRAQSSEGAAALRRKSDDDVDAIRSWAKAEIARIKQESDSRVAGRQSLLDREIEGHAAAIEDRVAEVQSIVVDYRRAMDTYYSRLAAEEDPARLATMAEAMPDAPSLESLGDLAGLVVTPVPVEAVATVDEAAPEPEAVAEPEPVAEAEAVAEAIAAPEAVVEAVAEPQAEVADAVAGAPEADATAEPIAPESADDETHETSLDDAESSSLAEADDQVAGELEAAGTAEAVPAGDRTHEHDGVARWSEGETPDGFPEPDAGGGDPVDRGAIMAALEAAAEAVVAAEAAAESADQAEAAADVAETAAELLTGRASAEEESDPEAEAALSARVDAGGFDTESYTGRLASLLPSHAEGAADGEPRTTQVVVNGLVSVASIASFKRHLGRLSGVTAVAVASGPDGEFVFNVTHRPDVSFRDAIPTMQGFSARVTATGDGVISVTARDPEAEG